MGHTLVIDTIEGAGRTFKGSQKLFIKNFKCVAFFATCSDYMNLTRQERRGDSIPDETKLYGFDWMRKDYENTYGYYWNGKKFLKDSKGNRTSEPDCEKVRGMTFSKLEKQYETIKNNKNEDEVYYVPWLSLPNGSSARIDLNLKWNHKPMEILFEYDANVLNISHEDIQDKEAINISKGYKNLTIECLGSFVTKQSIIIKADGLEVGKLMVMPNGILRQVNVGWCFVEFEGEGIDVRLLGNEVSHQKITKMLTYLGLKQAQLDVSVAAIGHTLILPQTVVLNQFLVDTGSCNTLVKAEKEILAGKVSLDGKVTSNKRDIERKIKGNTEVRYNGIVINNAQVFPFNKTKYTTPKGWDYVKGTNGSGDKNTIVEKTTFKNDLFAQYINTIGENNGYDIVLMFVNEKGVIAKKDAVNKKIKEISRLSGEAQAFNGKFVVIYEGFKEMVMVHEVLHCMSLKHSFGSVKEHSFKAIKTDNIMDYNVEGESDPRKSLWKWQWKKLWYWYDNK